MWMAEHSLYKEDYELALKYAPHLYYDKNEPFAVNRIGYSIFRQSGRSKSFERDILVSPEKAAYVIEYQLYYDFDIQHMYDLEHVWIYVGYNGEVADAEASAHGSWMNCFRYLGALEEGTHIPVYVQPGKHAMLPDGKLFCLFGDCAAACNKAAGTSGLLVTKLYRDIIVKDSYMDLQVCNYIRENYSFEPSLEFYPAAYPEDIIITWEELYCFIPVRINKLLADLGLGRA